MSGRERTSRARPELDLHRLRQFVAVVDAGSLTDAAGRLGVTQQALSASVRALEAQVGIELFSRSNGMRPSEAGDRLYAAATLLLAEASRALADVRAIGAGESPVLRVGHTPAISSVAVYDAVAAAIPPSVSVHLFQDYPEPLRQRVVAGDIDVMIRRGVSAPTGLDGAVIGFQRLNIAMRAEDAGDAESVTLADLADRTLITWSSDSHYATFLAAQGLRLGYEPKRVVSRFQGLDPVAAPLTEPGVYAMVATEPGSYLDGRVTVLTLADPVSAPLQALWLPCARGGYLGGLIDSWRSAGESGTADSFD